MTKISTKQCNGRLKVPEPTACGRAKDTEDASLVLSPSVGQSRRAKLPFVEKQMRKRPVMVPVLSDSGKPLMPCHPARARELLRSKKAVRRWYRGIFAIKLLSCRSCVVQSVVIGVDPGAKREAFTVMSCKKTLLNILSDSVSWVSLRVKIRKLLRRGRRFRKTPNRKARFNRKCSGGRVVPSIKSRQQIRVNIVKFIMRLYPVSSVAYENTRAATHKGEKKWNRSFSSIQDGKQWLYENLYSLGVDIHIIESIVIVRNRESLGLKKGKNPLSMSFDAHNVDSWVLANHVMGSPFVSPDSKKVFRIIPIQFHRRQLHVVDPKKGGFRRRYGGTVSLGLKRGSIVLHKSRGIFYVGGNSSGQLNIHDTVTGKMVSHRTNLKDLKVLCVSPWRSFFV